MKAQKYENTKSKENDRNDIENSSLATGGDKKTQHISKKTQKEKKHYFDYNGVPS